MKKTLFVALVATVALLATSCKKGEAPKAAFSWENDGLVVSFSNLSKNADSYKWEFGDGQTSTETSPKYTYAANGSYNVVLTATNKDGSNTYTETVVLKTAAIKIDGDFADWDKVIAEGKAVDSKMEDGKEYDSDGMKEMAIYVDEDFLYFMVRFDSDKEKTMPLDILLGTKGEVEDENPCTHYWDPIYTEYLIEFGKGDQFESEEAKMDWYDWNYNVLMKFNHEIGGWAPESWTTLSKNSATVSAKVPLTSTVSRVEGKISLENFEISKTYIYVAGFTSNSSWGHAGQIPAAEIVDATTVYPPMMKVNL